MKKIAFAFAATVAISSFAASTADAMNIGSLSRQRPVIVAAEMATPAYPAVCRDLACGVVDRKASDISPVLHIVFASISSFVLDHLGHARSEGQAVAAVASTISLASAD